MRRRDPFFVFPCSPPSFPTPDVKRDVLILLCGKVISRFVFRTSLRKGGMSLRDQVGCSTCFYHTSPQLGDLGLKPIYIVRKFHEGSIRSESYLKEIFLPLLFPVNPFNEQNSPPATTPFVLTPVHYSCGESPFFFDLRLF